jgi:uncharacterized membrane protein
LGSVFLTLRGFVPVAAAPVRYLHPLALASLALFAGLESYRLTLDQAGLGRDWAHAAFGAGAIVLLALVTVSSPKQRWPFDEQRELYMGIGALALCAGIGLWGIAFNLSARGLSAPLQYLPIVNPVDLAQLLGCAAVFAWRRAYVRAGHQALPRDLVAAIPTLLACFAFLWFNAMLARSVHQFANVPFSREALWRSVPLQVALSISWSVIALGMTVLGSRRGARVVWVAGAVLLGVVVLKLFAIDLARLSTIAKICTFLVVGVLLLAIGYLAPVPPAAAVNAPEGPKPDPEIPERPVQAAAEETPKVAP